MYFVTLGKKPRIHIQIIYLIPYILLRNIISRSAFTFFFGYHRYERPQFGLARNHANYREISFRHVVLLKKNPRERNLLSELTLCNCARNAEMLKREHCDEYFLARVNFAKRKSQQGEKKSSHKTKLESIKKRRVVDPREGEIVRGRGEQVGRRGRGERGMRQVGEPEFAQEAMKYVTGMMDVSA